MDDLTAQLLDSQDECTFIWGTRDGSPTGTIVSFFADRGRIWMTALVGSQRVRALESDPRCSVVITGKGTELGHARCSTLRGSSVLHRDDSARNWFFPIFAAVVLPDNPKGADGMVGAMNNPSNLIIEFVPDRVIPYDAHEQMVRANGGNPRKHPIRGIDRNI
jgi:hypothetical protein